MNTISRVAVVTATLTIGLGGLAACGSNDDGGGGSRRGQDDRAAAPRDQDHPLRELRQAALRGQGQGAVRRLQGRLPQRRPGRVQAAAAGPVRDHQRRVRARARPGRRQGRDHDREVRPGLRRPGHRVRPLHRGRRLLHLLRQRARRPDAGRGPRRGHRRQGRHPHAERLADRPERRAVQEGRPLGARRERPEDRGRVRQPRLEPGQRAEVHQLAVQQGRPGATSPGSTPPTTARPVACSPRFTRRRHRRRSRRSPGRTPSWPRSSASSPVSSS